MEHRAWRPLVLEELQELQGHNAAIYTEYWPTADRKFVSNSIIKYLL
jgi:hypothetical protein